MKKELIISSIWLLYSFSAKSQVEIGIKGGYDYYWMISTNRDDNYTQLDFQPKENSFSIGCLIIDQTNKPLNPGIEIEYQWRSFRIVNHDAGLAGSTDSDNNFDAGYLNLYMKPSFSFGSKLKFIVNTGLYLSYLVNSHVNGSSSTWIMGVEYDTTYEGSAKDYFSSTDLGIMAGVGVQVPVS